MVAVSPSSRPSIESIKAHPLFRSTGQAQRVNLQWRHQGLAELQQCKKIVLQIGATGKPKSKYVKLSESTLFVYDHKDAAKAKLRYPLLECQIELVPDLRSQSEGSLRRTQSSHNFGSPKTLHYTHKIEHPQLETLYLDIPQRSALVTAM